jgi:hypothetical protein
VLPLLCIQPSYNKKKRKDNWIGHILRRNCLLKQVIEGKIKGEIEVTRRQGRRRKKLLDVLKDRRGYSHLKEEAVDRNVEGSFWEEALNLPSDRLLDDDDDDDDVTTQEIYMK